MTRAIRPDLSRRGPLRLLDRDELHGPSTEVAVALLGTTLVRQDGGHRIEVRVVETEAYDESDPASHTHRGPTPGNATMFGAPGHAYVYFTYGMHHCANVVCGPSDHGAAVLLRAGAVVTGVEHVRERRASARSDRQLANGPAKLTQALGLDRTFDGVDLCDPASPVWLGRDDVVVDEADVRRGPRVGVRHAADRAWRFWIADVPEVSAYRRHPRAPASAG